MNDTISIAERARRRRQSQTSKQGLSESGYVKLGYSFDEAARITSLGRTGLFRAAKEGRLRVKKYGRRSLLTPQALEELIESLPEREPEAE